VTGTKRCNGPLHKGEQVPLDEFWKFKTGPRKGKPLSRCIHCRNFQKWGDLEHGLVPYTKVKFIFDELVNRLGKAETARRVGISLSFFWRHDIREYHSVRLRIVISAMRVLKECREKGEVRHKHSIIHGAAARGHQEKVVKELSRIQEYYNSSSDIHNEYSLKSHRKRKQEKRVRLTT
jgi:hypothetical protein